jgi:hypothetical protein
MLRLPLATDSRGGKMEGKINILKGKHCATQNLQYGFKKQLINVICLKFIHAFEG